MNKEIVKASEEVVGVSVENPQGDDLGEIKELMIDKHSGMVQFVVLDFGGFLGMGNKLFAMPWELFSYNNERNCFIIAVEKDKLEKMKGFDGEKWPNMADPTWSSNLYHQFGLTPTHMQSRTGRMQ